MLFYFSILVLVYIRIRYLLLPKKVSSSSPGFVTLSSSLCFVTSGGRLVAVWTDFGFFVFVFLTRPLFVPAIRIDKNTFLFFYDKMKSMLI